MVTFPDTFRRQRRNPQLGLQQDSVGLVHPSFHFYLNFEDSYSTLTLLLDLRCSQSLTEMETTTSSERLLQPWKTVSYRVRKPDPNPLRLP